MNVKNKELTIPWIEISDYKFNKLGETTKGLKIIHRGKTLSGNWFSELGTHETDPVLRAEWSINDQGALAYVRCFKWESSK